MPHVSKHQLSKLAANQIIDTFNFVISSLSKKDDVDKFLLDLLTSTERIMLAKRLAIILLLYEGLTESQIAETLHVTRVTVSRMQLFLEARGEGYTLALQELKNKKLSKDIKLMLIKLTNYSIRAAGGYVKPKIF